MSDGLAEMSLDGFHSDNAMGAKVHLDADGNLNWPVLFLYPEHEQTDFIAAFHENTRFIDHLMVMFAELPPWDLERKYLPDSLEVSDLTFLLLQFVISGVRLSSFEYMKATASLPVYHKWM
nr:PREDICTED: tetratricopeptide repeat protein 4-like [Apteryx mantelli mantelli]